MEEAQIQQSQPHKHERRRERHRGDRHKEPSLISEHVAQRGFVLEGNTLPQERHSFQKHLFPRLRGLRTQEVGRALARRFEARNRRCGERAAHDSGDRNDIIYNRNGRRHRRHREAVIENNVQQIRHSQADEVGAEATDSRCDEREQHILTDDVARRITERFQAGDLRTLFVDEPRHGGEHHERGHEQERNHQDVADACNFFSVGIEGLEAVIIVQRKNFHVFKLFVDFRFSALNRIFVIAGECVERIAVFKRNVNIARFDKGRVHAVGNEGIGILVSRNQVLGKIEDIFKAVHVRRARRCVGNLRIFGVVVARFAVERKG